MAINTAVSSTRAAQEPFTTGSVISQDGTTIGYRQLGHGPGVVLLHGAFESAQSHMQLAEALADTYTVTLPDRRGRGLSGPYSHDYSITQDVEDMEALLAKTGAHFVFGISSGAVIWLHAALTLTSIHKAALYEPPMSINGSLDFAWVARYESEMSKGKVASAMVAAMKGAQMGPPIFNAIPNWLLARLTDMMMNSEDTKATGDDITMRKLAPTFHYDGQLVVQLDGALDRFKAIQAEVLLLGGSTSPAYLKAALVALEKVLPRATRIEFPGLGHGGSGNSDRGGKPEVVAQALREFFA